MLVLPPRLATLNYALNSPAVSLVLTPETQPLDNKLHLQIYLENGEDVKYLFLLKGLICSLGA